MRYVSSVCVLFGSVVFLITINTTVTTVPLLRRRLDKVLEVCEVLYESTYYHTINYHRYLTYDRY